MKTNTIMATTIGICLLWSPHGQGYDVGTHAKMSEQAFLLSSGPSILAALGLTDYSKLVPGSTGLTDLNTGTALGWIREGAVREDGDSRCATRVRNHFYNPLNNTGLFLGLIQGAASTNWGLEDRGDEAEQDFSYADAKRYFWSALLPETEEDRQRDLALTFRSLGHVVHLVQDAAQPQHTRNDVHAGLQCPSTLGLLGPKSAYETHVETIAEQISYSGYPSVALPHPRDYWDDEQGRGIAEFSNRSFVSERTNFVGPPDDLRPASGFPLPDGTGAIEVAEDITSLLPGTSLHGVMRFISTPYEDRYLGTTDRNHRTSSYSLFTEELSVQSLLHRYALNRFNHEAAREILVPRAVGYSAGLIDHFFRGRIAISAPDDFAYAVTPYTDGEGSFSRLRMKIRNVTPNEETGLGTVRAIVRYRFDPTADLLLFPAYFAGGARYAISAPQEIELGRDDQEVTFDFSDDPIPARVGDVSLVVAYRGPLAGVEATEDDAIVFGGKDLYEPELITVGNSMDYDCHRDVLYDTLGLPADQRDPSGDGIRDLFGPWTLLRNFFLLRSTNAPYVVPSSANASFEVSSLLSAQYARFVALQDQRMFRLPLQAEDATEQSTGERTSLSAYGEFWGSINRFVDRPEGIVHEYNNTGPISFRTILTRHGAFHANGGVLRSVPCTHDLATASRPMSEVAGTAD